MAKKITHEEIEIWVVIYFNDKEKIEFYMTSKHYHEMLENPVAIGDEKFINLVDARNISCGLLVNTRKIRDISFTISSDTGE